MARIDSQFITRIIRHPEEDWQSCRIPAGMISVDVRPVYDFIFKEATSFRGTVPSMDTVLQFFPSFRAKKATEAITFYADLIRERYTERTLRDAVVRLSETLSAEEPDLQAAEDILTEATSELSMRRLTQVSTIRYGTSPQERLEALKEAKYGRAADYSLGHPLLDEDLIGSEKGDFYIIAGTPAAGKTWFLLKTLLNLWMKEHLNIVLFSYELSKKLLCRRLDSIVAGVPYNRFRRGILTAEEQRRFEMRLLKLRKTPAFFEIITPESCNPLDKSANNPARLDFLYNTLLRQRPHIVGVDGFYLMDGQGDTDWSRMAYLTRGFHAVTQATGITGWATTQLTKTSDEKNPKLRDLSFSWTFAQDTDGAFLLSRPENSFPILNVGKFREAEDTLKYALDFNPGERIEVQRMAPVTENPLMD